MSGVEILGIAAGVVQIADLGGKLSVKLFTFARKIKNVDKNIDSISQDIAATGAVLQQLGTELKKDEKLRLCSPEAIATAKSLMEDCHKIFKELNDAVDGKGRGLGSGAKVVLGLKQRLKYPFLEPQIDLLKANLEKLKSSLLVMLNVLIFAEQLKNQEALPILKDQRELLKTLLEEKVASQKQYDQVLKRLDQLMIEKDDTSMSFLTREITNTTNSSITLVDEGRSTETMPGNSQDDIHPDLPAHLQHRAEELLDHCRLVKTVIGEVNHAQYKIDLGIRYRTQELVLGSHYSEWAHLLGPRVNDAYQMKAQDRLNFLGTCPELKRHWLQRQFGPPNSEEQALTASRLYQQQANCTQDSRGLQQQMMPHRISQPMQQQQSNYAFQDYQMQMALLEQQNKKMLLMARQEVDNAGGPNNQNQPQDAEQEQQQQSNYAFQDYQMQMALLEHHNNKRLLMARQEQKNAGGPNNQNQPQDAEQEQQQQSNYAFQDYQMQMALLEQQNKKRLLMARQEVDNANEPSNQNQPQDIEQQEPPNTSLAKTPLDPSSSEKTAVVNVEKQCGVVLPTGRQCTRSLTCNRHSMATKRAVPGRSQPYDMLLIQHQKKNGTQPLKSTVDANAPISNVTPAAVRMPPIRSASQGPKDDIIPLNSAVETITTQSEISHAFSLGASFKLDFSSSDPAEVLENFDFDSFSRGDSRSRSRRRSRSRGRSQNPSRSLSKDPTASESIVDDQKQSLTIIEPSTSTTSQKRMVPWAPSDDGGERHAFDSTQNKRRMIWLPATEPDLTPDQQEITPPSAPTEVPDDTKSLKIDSEQVNLSRRFAGSRTQPRYTGRPEVPSQPEKITIEKRGRSAMAKIDRDLLPRNKADDLATSNNSRSKASSHVSVSAQFAGYCRPPVLRAEDLTFKRPLDARASPWYPVGPSAVETRDAAQFENKQRGDGGGDGDGDGDGESENVMDLIARYTLLDERDLMRAVS